MKKLNIILTSVFVLGLGVATAQEWKSVYFNVAADRLFKKGFEGKGTIKGDEITARLTQDEAQAACSDAGRSFGGKDGAAYYNKLTADQKKTIVYPADGKYVGDWKAGEKIAQSGKGLTWRNKNDAVNGGSCYNCHQISPEEISHGNIGPSLYQYGKKKGNSPQALRDTWARIYNSKGFNVCSWMPRFGHLGILSETQLKNVVALLHDPKSPVNQ